MKGIGSWETLRMSYLFVNRKDHSNDDQSHHFPRCMNTVCFSDYTCNPSLLLCWSASQHTSFVPQVTMTRAALVSSFHMTALNGSARLFAAMCRTQTSHTSHQAHTLVLHTCLTNCPIKGSTENHKVYLVVWSV